MNENASWVTKYKNKHKIEQFLMALAFLIPFSLAFVFGFLGGKMTTYTDETGTTVVDAAHPNLVWLSLACSLISFVIFITEFFRILHTRCDVKEYKNHTVMAYVLNKKCKLIIDGEETESVRRMNYKDFVILNGVTKDGIEVTCKVDSRNTSISFKEVEVINGNHSTKIVNNFEGKTKKSNKDELTPMQKKLVELAKNDTLASINPANVEEAKQKIDLYKDLDEID